VNDYTSSEEVRAILLQCCTMKSTFGLVRGAFKDMPTFNVYAPVSHLVNPRNYWRLCAHGIIFGWVQYASSKMF